MKKIIIALIICFLLPAFVSAIDAASCNLGDIQTAIANTPIGGTVNVPAGSCTWSNQLRITKGINLIGDGAGQTIITMGFNAANGFACGSYTNVLIKYDSSIDRNEETIEIAGFTFDANNRGGLIEFHNSDVTGIDTILLHNNIIKNTQSNRAVVSCDTFYGVIYKNTFENIGLSITSYGENAASWSSLTFNYGSAECLYYEDNNFIDGSDTFHDNGAGGRFCARYNTYTHGGTGLYPWFDAHGNQDNGNHANMGAEIYGNTVTHSYPTSGVRIFDHRGGKAIVWGNNVVSSTSVDAKVREEYHDSSKPPATGPEGQPQHVSDSYYWSNTRNGVTLIRFLETQDCCNAIAENSEFFNQDTSFDGRTGVGVGTYANRPSTCTAGVGYWATDRCEWNSNHPGNDGCLYKCISNNNWQLYYIPYTYPHPLRSGDVQPQCDTVSDCADQNCRTKACTAGQCVYSNIAPICPSASNVNCGAQITSTNGCGYCSGTGTRCSTGTCINRQCVTSQQTCSDGTAYGQCSTTRPKYCDNGHLINRCSQCGCASGQCQNDGSCKTQLEGDLDNDGDVDIFDLIFVAVNFGKSDFDPRADTNNDNVIDIFDIVYVASRFS